MEGRANNGYHITDLEQRKHFDWILWFQVGDFYELYEQDCDWAEREFGLKV